jgi:hypothetical protein
VSCEAALHPEHAEARAILERYYTDKPGGLTVIAGFHGLLEFAREPGVVLDLSGAQCGALLRIGDAPRNHCKRQDDDYPKHDDFSP